ncbi:MAG: histidinol-phosphate transaminase [Clostridia bacterium]|nr:histidinol-phosphate transaminase [Clostridia bacterium]
MEKVHGGDIYSYERKMLDFSANISPLGIQPEIIEAISKSYINADKYPDTEYKKLRQSIAEMENTDAKNIVCGNGAAEIIFDTVHAVKPKTVLLTAPSFAEYEKAADTVNCRKVFYTLKEENGFALYEDYLKLITDDTDMLFLCTPNNPTGRCVSDDMVFRILDKCRKTGTLAVIDECFLDFVKGGREMSALKYIDSYKNLLIVKAFTKMFAIPGIRLGYGVCSDRELIDKIYSTRQPWNISCTAEAAGEAACLIADRVIKETADYIEHERDFICGRLEALGIKYYTASANFILFRAFEGLKELMADKGVLIRSCSNYRGLDGSYYRTAVKGHEDNIKMLAALEECLWQRR